MSEGERWTIHYFNKTEAHIEGPAVSAPVEVVPASTLRRERDKWRDTAYVMAGQRDRLRGERWTILRCADCGQTFPGDADVNATHHRGACEGVLQQVEVVPAPSGGEGERYWEKGLMAARLCTCVWDVADDPAEANEDGDKIVDPDPECFAHGLLSTLDAERSERARTEAKYKHALLGNPFRAELADQAKQIEQLREAIRRFMGERTYDAAARARLLDALSEGSEDGL